jgi:hypothetical protein
MRKINQDVNYILDDGGCQILMLESSCLWTHNKIKTGPYGGAHTRSACPIGINGTITNASHFHYKVERAGGGEEGGGDIVCVCGGRRV